MPWPRPIPLGCGSSPSSTPAFARGRPPPSSGKTSTLPGMRSTSTRPWRAAHGPSRPQDPRRGPGISPCARSCETASWRPVGRRRARSFPRPGAGCRRQQPAAAVERLCPGPGPAHGGQSPGRRGGPARHCPGPHPYCLRHTFCTDLRRAGVPINVAKELMGHANISVTANIYTHRDQKVLHSNMAKLTPRASGPPQSGWGAGGTAERQTCRRRSRRRNEGGVRERTEEKPPPSR